MTQYNPWQQPDSGQPPQRGIPWGSQQQPAQQGPWGPPPAQQGDPWAPPPARRDTPWSPADTTQPLPQSQPAQAPQPQAPQPPEPQGPPRRPPRGRTGVAAVAAASVLSAALASGATYAITRESIDQEVARATATSQGTQDADRTPAAVRTIPNYQDVVSAVIDTVVAISVQSGGGAGAGSGVIIDEGGHVLTNDHVISGASTINVTLADGRILAAEVVGTDQTTDLAVLAIQDPPEDLAVAELGTSADLSVGQDVIAVGNPLGLSSTVTTGIISALDRPVSTSESGQGQNLVVTNAIQVDAAINPGNSGGPLFDLSGRVIGITSSIATLSQGGSGSIGLGFAIPVDLASRIADELIASGTAQHALLGVTMQDNVVAVDGVNRTGAQVRSVVPGSGAEAAGIVPGDVVVEINGNPVSGSESLTAWVRSFAPSDVISLGVVRDGELVSLDVTLSTAQ